MTELFGGDVAQAVSVLATFCDGGEVLVKNALIKSPAFQKVQAKLHPDRKLVYEFNNSAIFVDPAKDPQNLLTKTFWNMGMDSMKIFMENRIN